MFTIIIPLYNKSNYLVKTIQSIVKQTFQEFELIIIDDGSTDDSLEQLRLISDKLRHSHPVFFDKLRVFEQDNQGVSTTRNRGISLAKYEYIAFLDADDWWEPTFLQEMVELINEFPNAGIYGSSYFKVKNVKRERANIGVEPAFQSGIINYFECYAKTLWMPLWTGAVIVPKKVLVEFCGFKKELKLGEDFYLWTQIAGKYPVILLNRALSNYNQDVEIQHRAVGEKFYLPSEHVIYQDFSFLEGNKHFKILFDRLAVYALLPYYIENINLHEARKIISSINWKNVNRKYFYNYKVLPKFIVVVWFKLRVILSRINRLSI
jgi:glycosyltransferase involved in cell wall biosynthesis